MAAIDKQLLLMEYIVSNSDLYARVSNILNEDYFDVRYRKVISFINHFYTEYGDVPNEDQIRVETNITLEKKKLSKADIKYCEVEIEKFCKERALENAVFIASNLLGTEESGAIEKIIKDAMSVSLIKDLGLNYFENVRERLEKELLNPPLITTGYPDLDDLIGKFRRKEITYFAGLPGTGKSMFMLNIARNMILNGYNVIYITLELAEEVVAKRFDSMMTGYSQLDLLKHIDEVSELIENKSDNCGNIYIKRMKESSTTCNHIRAYLKEFFITHNFLCDVLVVDYADIMAPIQKVSAENQFIKDKYISEELRALADEFDIHIMTASQLNRGQSSESDKGDANYSNIAGGISKVNTTDNLLAIIQNDVMRAEGRYSLKALKTRSSGGVGSFAYFNWDKRSLRITDINNESPINKQKFIKDTKEADIYVGDVLKEIVDDDTAEAIEQKNIHEQQSSNLKQTLKSRGLTGLLD